MHGGVRGALAVRGPSAAYSIVLFSNWLMNKNFAYTHRFHPVGHHKERGMVPWILSGKYGGSTLWPGSRISIMVLGSGKDNIALKLIMPK